MKKLNYLWLEKFTKNSKQANLKKQHKRNKEELLNVSYQYITTNTTGKRTSKQVKKTTTLKWMQMRLKLSGQIKPEGVSHQNVGRSYPKGGEIILWVWVYHTKLWARQTMTITLTLTLNLNPNPNPNPDHSSKIFAFYPFELKFAVQWAL